MRQRNSVNYPLWKRLAIAIKIGRYTLYGWNAQGVRRFLNRLRDRQCLCHAANRDQHNIVYGNGQWAGVFQLITCPLFWNPLPRSRT